MNIYEDLSYYSNDHFEYSLNVGWIPLNNEKCKEFNNSSIILDKIIPFLDYPFNTVRDNSFVFDWQYNGKTYNLGYSEIRIISSDGQVYASPDTILYSLSSQGYKPPEEFIDAILNGFSVDSDYYKSYVENYNDKNFWGATEKQKKDNLLIEECFNSHDPLKLFKQLSDGSLSMNAVTNDGSLLNKAIINKNEIIAKWLLNNNFPTQNYFGLELLTAIEYKMNSIANVLIDQKIPMPIHSYGKNPLFRAVLHNNNEIAKRLFLERPELRVKYSNEFVKDCDILQLCANCNNIEMFSFIKNNT